MKRLILAAIMPLACICAGAQELHYTIDSTVITAFRAGEKTPVAHTEITEEELHGGNSISSIPMALSLQPSVVSLNEGGNGLGNSKMRVRGSDATRINVTINGITLNDAESQEVFWVNIPALSGMLSSVQLQRGVGTSVNGPGAFGGSINMQSGKPRKDPYGEVEYSTGSFGTNAGTAAFGTGLLGGQFSLDARYNYSTTEGYVDNGFARLHSLYATACWMKGSTSVRFNYILGKQRSGITWEGLPSPMLATDRRANPRVTPGDCDDYFQNHMQGIFSHQFNSRLNWTTTINYTKGHGYYEYQTPGAATDAMRYAEDNDYYALSSNLKWSDPRLSAIANFSCSMYDGSQFGYFVTGDDRLPNLYDNNAWKRDLSTFLRAEWKIARWLNFYADLQYRHIYYELAGPDEDGVLLDNVRKFDFFNPKAGLTFDFSEHSSAYASLAVGHKEPCRTDMKAAIKSGRQDKLLSELMYDWELGWKYAGKRFSVTAGIYLMEYRNQLLETGKLSEVGYAIKENVPLSWRRGIELAAGWQALKWMRIEGNLTLSTNKIKDYTAWVDLYDDPVNFNWLGQVEEHFGTTDMLMSPSAIGMVKATFTPVESVEASLSWKYVGKQYYDNTSCNERSLPSYNTFSLSLSWQANKTIKFAIFADNLLNRLYVADAWVYRARFADGSPAYVEDGLFPQAEVNFNAKMTITL